MKKLYFSLILLFSGIIFLTNCVESRPYGLGSVDASMNAANTTPPEIIVYSDSGDSNRGAVMKKSQNKGVLTIQGRVTAKSGVAELLVNKRPVKFDDDGNFQTQLLLERDQKTISISAKDKKDISITEIFEISREKGLIALTKRGFAGDYYALVIGNNKYSYLNELNTAVADAKGVSKILKNSYGFKTKLLLNATRSEIVTALNDYNKKLGESDYFLLYYAGHGYFDEASQKAYWLPIDAKSSEDTQWIIVDTITSNLKRLSSRHALVISDSCYSGTLAKTRDANVDLKSMKERSNYMEKIFRKKSRTLLASGGNEPVSDAGGGNHSIFAAVLIKALKNMDSDLFTAEELYYKQIKVQVGGRTEQTPEFHIISDSGHNGGAFVFQKKRK